MDEDVLSREESLRLLAGVAVGRVVFTIRALPAVQPVSFILDEDSVVFGADAGSQLVAAVRDAVVAFQADDIDPASASGWSVTITGYARQFRYSHAADRLRAMPCPPVPGERRHFVGIRTELVTGVRLGEREGRPAGPGTRAPAGRPHREGPRIPSRPAAAGLR